MNRFKNVNKRSQSDKEEQRADGGERMKKHGTAKERLQKRNRLRAKRKQAEQSTVID
jgi:hypothetical protein